MNAHSRERTEAKDWTGNQRSIYTALGASNHSDKDRQQHDYYATEPRAMELLLAGKDKGYIIKILTDSERILLPELSRLSNIHTLKREEIKSSGYVVDTLEAAFWCFFNTDSYADCVLTAVNLGEDTDTIAAVAGGLAGIYYGCSGESGVPDEWIAQIPRRNWIKDLCAKLIFED